jgi:hypothetical protein
MCEQSDGMCDANARVDGGRLPGVRSKKGRRSRDRLRR